MKGKLNVIQSVGLHDYSPIAYNNMPFKANSNNTVKYNISEPEKKKNTGWKILGAVSAAALIAAGACLHKGTKSLGKNAKIGERLEQGLNEILGKSFTKELADGTRIVKQTKNGKISSCAKYKGDTLLFKNEYTYGDSGKISHIKRIKGGELSEINFKYNGDNKLSEIIKEITKEGSEKKDIINIDFRNYGYGRGYIQRKENGKVTGITKFDWGKFKYRHEYEFGQNGKIRHIKNTESGKSSDINFKYDENQKLSNITKKIMTENGKLIVSSKYNGSEFLYKQKFEYGKNGKISRIEKTDKDGIKIVREPFYSNDNKVIGFRIENELTAFHVGTRKPKYVVNKRDSLCQYDADGKLVFQYVGDDPRFWSNVGDVNRISEVGGGKAAAIKTGNGPYITYKLDIDKQFNEMVNEFYIENDCKYIFTKKNQPDIKYIEYSCKIGDSRYHCGVTNGKIMQIGNKIGKSLEKDIANYHIDTGNVEIIDNSYTIDKIKEIVDKTKVIDDNIAKADKVMGDVNEAWSYLKSMTGLKKVECVDDFINRFSY